MNHLFDRMDNVLLATIYLGTNDAVPQGFPQHIE